MNKDREYETKAIELLDGYLSGVTSFPPEVEIDKEKLLEMYMDSRSIVRLNHENLELSRAAESVWSTCIRVVRCLGLVGEEGKTLSINQKEYFPEAISLYKNAVSLHVTMKELENC
ncbi:MAG: hypothetical protein CMI00_00230 [Oceanospirillaceae bacterium]|mgnify:CR=1 FL=1|nr:hypothetical protein [Oceanospirillaceae bacterium]|tara:strand:+ start:5077 stop:5424 length:348 start_codon:yes stop_codon:yes gene_type:complete